MATDSLFAKLPEPGAVIGGKYEIVGVLGKGGMGVVFEAIHSRLQQRIAIKMLYPHVRGDPDTVERFEREARAAGQLLSPNIARVLDVETDAELPYIVMEFLEGNDLDDEIEKHRQLPITTAVDYMLQACVGIREAHALGIIHRDLKPANLFLCQTPDGPVVKILDFGISKITTEVDARLTAAMTTMGSPIYMSPEQLREARHVDQRADIWGLGIILYELIAGRPPFEGSVTVVTASIIADTPPPLSSLRQGVPKELDAVLAKALEKDPEKRWRDAEELAEALAPFGSPEAVKRLHASLLMPAPTPRSLGRRSLSPMMTAPAGEADETIARPSIPHSAPMPVSETRHSFTAADLGRVMRPRPRWGARMLIASAVVATAVIAIAVALHARAPAESTAAAVAAAPAEPPAPSIPASTPSASATAITMAVASHSPPTAASSAHTNSAAPASPASTAPPAAARPAAPRVNAPAAKNPLHL